MRALGILLAAALVSHRSQALSLPCSIHGLAVSQNGFAALIQDVPRDRLLPLIVAPDTSRASSPESLTLLQLMQGIDLGGPTFPPERLETLAGIQDATLQQVEHMSDTEFHLCLCVAGSDNLRIPCPTAFDACALSMRYEVPIVVEAAVLEAQSFSAADLEVYFPSCFTIADAAQQRSDITKRMAGLPPNPSESARSALDVQSFDVAALRQAVDECVPKPPPVEEGLNANAAPPDMLLRVLELARQKGDYAAVEKIEKQIAVEELKRDLKQRD